MALQDSDLFIVQRNQQSYKMPASEITSFAAPANMVTTNTDQSISGTKTFTSSSGLFVTGTGAQPLTLTRTGNVNNVAINLTNDANTVFFGLAANVFAIGTSANLTSTKTFEVDHNTGKVTSSSGAFGNLTVSGNTIVSTGTIGLYAGGTSGITFHPKDANATLQITNTDSKNADIRAGGLTANRTYTLPNKTGTFALTSDLPTVETYTAGDGLDLTGTEFKVDNTVVRTTGNQTIGGTKSFSNLVQTSKIFRYNGNAQVLNPASYNLNNGQFWTCVGGAMGNPSNAAPSMSGLILFTGAPTSWGGKWKFPGGVAPDIPANSVVPYYVTAHDVIHVGLATPVGT